MVTYAKIAVLSGIFIPDDPTKIVSVMIKGLVVAVIGSSSNLFQCGVQQRLESLGCAFHHVVLPGRTFDGDGISFGNFTFIQPPLDRILWLASHVDPEALRILRNMYPEVPILAISSGAVMDVFIHQIDYSNNDYIKAKMQLHIMARDLNVHTFVPGFYIEDVMLPVGKQSKGLHGDTNQVLFGSDTIDKDQAWLSKKYAVTPKSAIVNAIESWIKIPSMYPSYGTPIICSTDVQVRSPRSG